MGTLIIVAYEDKFKAEEVRLQLWKMQRDDLIDLEDAVVVVKDEKGKVKLRQAAKLDAKGALRGGFWGLLIGMLFLSPVLGAAIGAVGGTVTGALNAMGIDDPFLRELAANIKPGGSALFVLVREAKPDEVLEQLRGTGGKILKTTLSNENEDKLRAVLTEAEAGAA